MGSVRLTSGCVKKPHTADEAKGYSGNTSVPKGTNGMRAEKR